MQIMFNDRLADSTISGSGYFASVTKTATNDSGSGYADDDYMCFCY